jgi:hypothetical protein
MRIFTEKSNKEQDSSSVTESSTAEILSKWVGEQTLLFK